MKRRKPSEAGRRRRSAALLLAVGLLLPAAARPAGASDLTIVSKRVHIGLLATKYPPETYTTYLTPRSVIVDSSRQRTIVDLDHDTATLIDKSAETYSVISLKDLTRKAAEADSSGSGARQIVTGQLRRVEIKPTQETTTLVGHKAKKYVMTRGAATTDIWVTEDFSVPEPLRPWMDLGAVLAPAGAALVDKLSELKGVQLKSESWALLGTQKQGLSDEVTALRQEPPPQAMTAIPAGFRKVPWPGLQDEPGS